MLHVEDYHTDPPVDDGWEGKTVRSFCGNELPRQRAICCMGLYFDCKEDANQYALDEATREERLAYAVEGEGAGVPAFYEWLDERR